MTIDGARRWLIFSSLTITGCQILFLVVAPVTGFPLSYPKNLDLLQIISPVFLGYLGSATHWMFQPPSQTLSVQRPFLGTLVVGPLIIYLLAVTAAFGAFGYANRLGAPSGSGISVDNLATILSIALGVLAVTTGVISSYLFVAPDPPNPPAVGAST